ncbi:MAG: hypothetical protein KAS02_02565 [Candidatus Pacebacteria bacterium]|nr:hypothetical protein [Candidatus Paceibacterota bacterium]
MRIFILNILYFLLIFNITSAESLGISFVDNFRYSQESFFAGEDVRVYSTLQNNYGFDLQGIIHFYDNDKFIGDFNFLIADGRVVESWTDWRPSEGEHNLSVKIFSLKKLEIAKDPKVIDLIEEVLIVKKIDIDIDTDKDGIGNKNDLDDDNDGFSDKEEIERGTNSLVFDENIKQEVIVAENPEKTTKIIANLFEDTKEITSIVLEKSKELTENTKVVLENHKELIDEEIKKDKVIELAQKESASPIVLQDEEQEGLNFYTASVINSVPNLKEMYSFFLGTLIYILNSWWILLGVICFIFWFLWRSIKNKLLLRRF